MMTKGTDVKTSKHTESLQAHKNIPMHDDIDK